MTFHDETQNTHFPNLEQEGFQFLPVVKMSDRDICEELDCMQREIDELTGVIFYRRSA